MKILLVSSATPEHRIEGGIVSHLALLERDLTTRGHRVHRLAAVPSDGGGRPPNPDVTLVPPPLDDGVPLEYHRNLRSVYRQLRSVFSPDVVHIHSQSGTAVAMEERRIPIVTTIHAAEPSTVAVGGRRLVDWVTKVERSARRGQMSRLLSCSDRIFVPSPKTARDLERFCPRVTPSDLHIMPVGVDLELFRPAAKNASRAVLGYREEFVILHVGRLVAKKGADELVRAAPEILAEIPEAVFVIVGTGPALASLKSEATRLGVDHALRFVGAVPNYDLPEFYNAADVFINPTRENETFGLTTVEAMACGLPVIVSRLGAATGVATPEQAMIYASPEELVSLVKRTHADSELRRELSEKGQQWAQQFSFETVGSQLIRCYEKLVASGKTQSAAHAHRGWGSFWAAALTDGSIRRLRRMHQRMRPRTRGRAG